MPHAEYKFPLISAAEIDKSVSLSQAIDSQRKVFGALSRGEAVMGSRGVIGHDSDTQFAYIARASEAGPIVIKFGSVTPSNSQRGIPVVQSHIGVLDPETGSLQYFVDGETVTKIRTVAASMLAAEIFANPIKRVAIVGAGHQGIAHAVAVITRFSPEVLTIVSRTPKTLADLHLQNLDNILLSTDIHQSVREADLIFMCTNSAIPVLNEPLGPGKTLISIGAFAPTHAEVGVDSAIAADAIFADQAETTSVQCGSLVGALKRTKKKWHTVTSIGDVLNGVSPGRTNSHEVIHYYSVGLGVQDAAIVELLIKSTATL